MKTFEDLIAFCKPISVTGTAPNGLGKLCQDSRKVEAGDLFIAVKGYTVDGHNFIDKAIENGASVIISEKPVELRSGISVVVVKNTRVLLGPLAQTMVGYPAKKLTVIGITGTNGKTTVATLIWQALTNLGEKVSLLGTVEKRINEKSVESRLTTSDPIELAEDMKEMVEAGSRYVVMEVSSHALHQHRVEGIPFYVAVFTNLSLDHLDYHQSMDEYAEAKKLLFDSLETFDWAITNLDDPKGEWIISDTEARILNFSFDGKGNISAEILKEDETGTTLLVEGTELHTPLIGRFNAYNIVEALLACTVLGIDGKHCAEALEKCIGAPGRMERVNNPEKLDHQPLVLVDYAHTPDALENVSKTLFDLKKPEQNLIILFGCGGDRDKTKRSEMAKIAEKYGDYVMVTSDNPRTEDPESIIKDIHMGFSDLTKVSSITSREDAIKKVINDADSNSIVLIAGKGHETYQEVNGKRHHFDDREIARKALDSRNGHPKNSEVA
ncbi:MAG: UDP-N-acetylmuramoyl-L-alanyl-D-glutamate--2,6-diaminopimelate ligase [Balneolaceae bacterium]